MMEAVDTRYVKFGPDIGQLQKAGRIRVKVVKDFLPVVRHVHLKDFDGGRALPRILPARAGEGRPGGASSICWRAQATT